VEGCGEAKPPRTHVPARGGQAAWRTTHGPRPPRAGNNRLVESLRPSTPPRWKATAYVLLCERY